jgi:hypothetical protein
VEYFILANSFAAPFVSDQSISYIEADTPADALTTFATKYAHPAGLFSAACYESADDYHKSLSPLAMWLCNHEIERSRLTANLGCFSYLGHAPGKFEIDGKLHEVENPKAGRVI